MPYHKWPLAVGSDILTGTSGHQPGLIRRGPQQITPSYYQYGGSIRILWCAPDGSTASGPRDAHQCECFAARPAMSVYTTSNGKLSIPVHDTALPARYIGLPSLYVLLYPIYQGTITKTTAGFSDVGVMLSENLSCLPRLTSCQLVAVVSRTVVILGSGWCLATFSPW